jgi:hypothetical protein
VSCCLMRWGCTRCAGAGTSSIRCAMIRHRSVRGADAYRRGMDSARCGNMLPSSASSAARVVAAIGHSSTATMIASAALTYEAVPTPAVAIAPASPWTHAEEDPVVEVPWPVISIRRAGVRRVVVVAISASRWNTDADHDLRRSRWRKGQPRQQCRCTENRLE